MTNRGLLLSVPVPTQTGLPPAGPMQLAGRNTQAAYPGTVVGQKDASAALNVALGRMTASVLALST